MASRKSLVRYDKIFATLLFALFGIIALVLGYKAVMTNTEQRSRAAETQTIYKQWEFNGRDSQGWSVSSPTTSVMKAGALVVTAGRSALPSLRNTTVDASVPAGLKTVSFSLSVGSVQVPARREGDGSCGPAPDCRGRLIELPTASRCPVYRCQQEEHSSEGMQESDDSYFRRSISNRYACPEDTRTCADGTSVGRILPNCDFVACPGTSGTVNQRRRVARKFTALLYYRLKSKDRFERPIEFKGSVGGGYQTYSVTLHDIAAMDINSLRIVFTSGVKAGEAVAFDWIRLLGPVNASSTHAPTPHATPTLVACDGPDGSACQLEGCQPCPTGRPCPMVCRPQYGTCLNHRCINETPQAPEGCHYQQVRCVRAPCNPVLVCPSGSPARGGWGTSGGGGSTGFSH